MLLINNLKLVVFDLLSFLITSSTCLGILKTLVNSEGKLENYFIFCRLVLGFVFCTCFAMPAL